MSANYPFKKPDRPITSFVLFLVSLCVAVCGMIALEGRSSSLERLETRPSTRTIRDRAGRTVAVPTLVRRVAITCYGGVTQEISVMGAAGAIVAQPSIERFPVLLRMFPRFAHVPDVGAFNNVNLEELLALKPDLVFAPIISAGANEGIEATGIPVIVVAVGRADIEGFMEELRMMGAVFSQAERAAALVSYWKERLALIERRTAAMPEAERKRVFYTSPGIPFRTEGSLWWGHHFIAASGGVNVAREVTKGGDVTVEQLLAWDPDAIVITTNSNVLTSREAILGTSQLQSIKAVRNECVYECPVGAFWWDRPSPEAILGILWLSKTLYPDMLSDIDLEKETRGFFAKF